jgi:hypothetical protein
MGAWDVATKTIHHDSWDDGEEVVLKEPTYGETIDIQKTCTGKDGELDEVRLADMMLMAGIVSWTFKRNGKVEKVTLPNIKALPTSYVTFIAQELGGFAVNADDDFPGQSRDVSQG